jgi:hypothetical protein
MNVVCFKTATIRKHLLQSFRGAMDWHDRKSKSSLPQLSLRADSRSNFKVYQRALREQLVAL